MTTFAPNEMARSLYPAQVEYRLAVGQGVRCISVLLHGQEPRIMSWSERFGPTTNKEITPMSMSLSEIELFVIDARSVLGV